MRAAGRVLIAVALIHAPVLSFLVPAGQTNKNPSLRRRLSMRAEDLVTSGKLDADALARLPTTTKGLLYLATDEGSDKAVEPNGVVSLREACPGLSVEHVPINVKALSLSTADAALSALSSLPSPTMVMCLTGGRASAVVCLAKAVQDNMDVKTTMQWAAAQSLPFLKSPHLRDWVAAAVARRQFAGRPLLFRPLFEETSWTYSYILACPKTREAVIIDPVDLTVDRDVDVVREMGLTLKYAINTHCHADHITGSGLLHQKVPGCASVIAEASGAVANLKVKDGDIIHFGERWIEARSTPGHTDGCMTFVTDDYSMVFTGDALLIRGCGRTDFQQGSPVSLYASIHSKIFSLPAETLVYPGHDYKGRMFTTIEEEKRFNPRLSSTTEAQFVEIMNNLKLPYPKKIDAALPSNKVDGMLGHQ